MTVSRSLLEGATRMGRMRPFPNLDRRRQMRCFECHTNRGPLNLHQGKDGHTLEYWMHEYECAAIWEYPQGLLTNKGRRRRVAHLEHMRLVEKDDLIFMWAKEVPARLASYYTNAHSGIIGVGEATGPILGPIPENDKRRIRPIWPECAYANCPEPAYAQLGVTARLIGLGEEYQVPLKWHAWEPRNPCPFNARVVSFCERECKDFKAVLRYFKLEHLFSC